MSEKLDLYPHFRVTNSATFGVRGSILDPVGCPEGRKACVPETGEDCPHFMGHDFKGCRAFFGDRAPICCAILLRASLAKAEGLADAHSNADEHR